MKPILLLAFISSTTIMFCSALTSAQTLNPPTAYHLSFENMDFLDDDLAAKYTEPSLEQRNLLPVQGKFGKALHNANVFSRTDLEKTSMSTWDLDPLLEVLVHRRFGHWSEYKIGRMEPYIWGTGRIKGESGCVAFWAKGKRVYPGYLFFQGSSSFGRFEQYLIAVELKEDNSLEAYVQDARYRYHRIKSKPVWNNGSFNHVAFAWDRSEGLALYLNGEEIASNWGTDAWWATQIPGLFHMPMCGFTYDEFWIFERPLNSSEIKRLMKDNRPPHDTTLPDAPDREAVKRLRKAFIGEEVGQLPVVRPSDGKSRIVFREIFPEWAGDGCANSPFVLDGKYELAWPQDYTSFTNILGDSDFHPEKVDFRLPRGSTVNYVTVEGNLAGAKMLAGNGDDDENMLEIISVTNDNQMFYGAMFEPVSCERFRIPFLKGYGSPPGYEPGLHLALTGDIRIHEVGFFNVSEETVSGFTGSFRHFVLDSTGEIPPDNRCGYAMRTLNDRRNSLVLALTGKTRGGSKWVYPGNFSRINLLAGPWEKAESITSLELNLKLKNADDGDFVILRLHDPGVPARIWTKLVFRLEDFERGRFFETLRLKMDFTDIKMAPGDRLWLDIAFSGKEEVLAGGKGNSTVTVKTVPLECADGRYAEKALKPAQSDFSKLYYWYYPWTAMRENPDPENPPTFGGFYDIVTYPLTVIRTEPDNFLSNMILELALIPFAESGAERVTKSRDNNPELWPPVRQSPADNSPEWAFYMNYYLTRYRDIVYWWAERQNPDGQVGGGWNDDVLFASRLPGVFLYTGDKKARVIFNRIFEGLERTRMFHDGYCNIDPMDFIHVEDLVRNRYEGLLFEPGDPYKMKIAMRTAWRLDKPEETPVNYIDGKSFKYDSDLIHWYWGKTPDYQPYSATFKDVGAKMKEIAPAMDDVIRFRYTEAGMFTDGSNMPGCYDIKRVQVGGGWGPWVRNISLAVSWENGGEPEIPKWVESATDTSFVAHFYSYDMIEQNVTARFYRLKKGIYRITLAYEGKDAAKGMIVDRIEELTRFSKVTVPVRPGREIALKVQCIKLLPDPGLLPDLAVSELGQSGRKLKAVINNFGISPASQVTVRVENRAGQTIAEEVIDNLKSAEDFIPGEVEVVFSADYGLRDIFRVIVDPENSIEEIFEENNSIEYIP